MICIFRFAGYSIELSKRFVLPDSLADAGQLQHASVEYERVAYEAFDNEIRTIALLKKASCQLHLQQLSIAQKTCLRITYFGLSDSLNFEARYRTALYCYLNKNFEEAVSQLLAVNQFLPDTYKRRSKLLYALSLNETNQWDKAKSELLEWCATSYESDSIAFNQISISIQELYKKKNQPKLKKPERAVIWATILPGSGQLYSGYLLDGAFTAVMVLTGLGIAAYGIFIVNYYATGAIVGYGIFQRFYVAGQNRSEFLAKKRNHKSTSKYNEILEQFILGLPTD